MNTYCFYGSASRLRVSLVMYMFCSFVFAEGVFVCTSKFDVHDLCTSRFDVHDLSSCVLCIADDYAQVFLLICIYGLMCGFLCTSNFDVHVCCVLLSCRLAISM